MQRRTSHFAVNRIEPNQCQCLSDSGVDSRTVFHNSGFKNCEVSESSRPVTAMSTLSRGVRLAKSQDGGILLDIDHGVFFNLNPVGARIIELLQQDYDPSSLVRAIGSEFHAPHDIVKGDVDDFLSLLREQRLLNGTDADGRSEASDA